MISFSRGIDWFYWQKVLRAGEDQDQDKLPPAPIGVNSRGGEWVHHYFLGTSP